MIQSLFNVKNIHYGFLALGIQILLATFSANVYGQPTFQRLYGTLDNDKGYSITGCSSGGYLVSGSTINFYTIDPEVYLIRITENGDTIWTQTYANPNIWDENALVCEHADHSFLVGNYSAYDSSSISIHKYSDHGTEIWTKKYSIGYQSFLTSIISSYADSSILFCGSYHPAWPMWSSIFVIKTNNNGEELWQQSFTGSYLYSYYSKNIVKTNDGGFIICGSIDYPEFDPDKGLLIKINAAGQMQWMKEYYSQQSSRSFYISDCRQLPDSSYMAIGVIYDAFMYENKKPGLLKIDKNGNTLWLRQLEMTDHVYASILTDSSSNLLLAGTGSTAQILKISTEGEITDSISFNLSFNVSLYQTIIAHDNGYIMTGSAAENSGYGGSDVAIIKANPDGIITYIPEVNSNWNTFELSVWPNPCTEKIEVESEFPITSLSIFDTKGNCLYKSNEGNTYTCNKSIQTGSFPKGLLYIQCITDQGVFSQKLIKL